MMRFRSLAFATVILVVAARADCAENEDATCDSNTAPASLLQKVFKRDEKNFHVQDHAQPAEPAQPAAACANQAQNRCWYLSQVGESCADTCARAGRGFSYVLADHEATVTPMFVGHEPTAKQQPWAAFECYVSSEDRYHTANPNAVKHFLNDIATWSHKKCNLACPCSLDIAECAWKQPPACAAEFVYQGVTYSGCVSVDTEHDRPWCQHHYQHTDGAHDWSFCTQSCGSNAATRKEEGCVWNVAASCVKEFDYEGTHFVGCTDADHDTPWCSNTDPYQGSWNHCVYSCADKNEKIESINQVARNDNLLCFWKPTVDCSTSFEYKGIDYTGCATVDHPTPWCSKHRIHQGIWNTCKRVCSSSSESVTPGAR